MSKLFPFAIIFILTSSLVGCVSKTNSNQHEIVLHKSFEKYWYGGKAEITSFTLKQARYGEIHEGKAVSIYVTEPFSEKKQVKIDDPSSNEHISVLKLNRVKKFNTGVYPYAIMTSVFTPLSGKKTLKINTSVQEWCGQAFSQLNLTEDQKKYTYKHYSYFESEGDLHIEIENTLTEDEIWNLLRIDPNLIDTGKTAIIPSLEYCRLKHIDTKPYTATIKKNENELNSIHISYEEINRSLTIYFNPNFPYKIQSWEEQFMSGFGNQAQTLTTTAIRDTTIKLDYWNKNSVKDSTYRELLKL